MYVDERDAYTEAYRGAPGCVFWAIWLVWVLANFIAFTLGESLGQSVERVFAPQVTELPRVLSLQGRVGADGVLYLLPALAGGVAAGVVLGIGQGLVLLPFLKLGGGMIEWMVATIIGRTVGWVAIYVLARQMAGLVLDKHIVGLCVLFVLMAGTGIIAGVALGYPQGIVLRRRVHHPGWWVLSNIPGPVTAALMIEVALYIEIENTLRDSTTAIIAVVTSISTGIALMDLLRHPTTQAEWMKRLRWRKDMPKSQREDTVLGSSLYEPTGPPTAKPPE